MGGAMNGWSNVGQAGGVRLARELERLTEVGVTPTRAEALAVKKIAAVPGSSQEYEQAMGYFAWRDHQADVERLGGVLLGVMGEGALLGRMHKVQVAMCGGQVLASVWARSSGGGGYGGGGVDIEYTFASVTVGGTQVLTTSWAADVPYEHGKLVSLKGGAGFEPDLRKHLEEVERRGEVYRIDAMEDAVAIGRYYTAHAMPEIDAFIMKWMRAIFVLMALVVVAVIVSNAL